MKTKLTNEQVFGIAYLLKTNYPDLTKYDKRFNFAVSRTLSNIQPIASDILKARETGIERFKEFDKNKSEIINKYEKDENGKIIDSKHCQSEVDNLVIEYKDAIEERQKEIDLYNEILQQEVEVDIIQCKFEALPDDFDFNILRVLVKESDEEIEVLL